MAYLPAPAAPAYSLAFYKNPTDGYDEEPARLIIGSSIRGYKPKWPEQRERACLRSGVRPSEFFVVITGKDYKRMDKGAVNHCLYLPQTMGHGVRNFVPLSQAEENEPLAQPVRRFTNLRVVNAKPLWPSYNSSIDVAFPASFDPADDCPVWLHLADVRSIHNPVRLAFNVLLGSAAVDLPDEEELGSYPEALLKSYDPLTLNYLDTHWDASGGRRLPYTWREILQKLNEFLPSVRVYNEEEEEEEVLSALDLDRIEEVAGPRDWISWTPLPEEIEDDEETDLYKDFNAYREDIPDAEYDSYPRVFRTPVNVRFNGIDCWEALSRCLDAIGCTVCPDDNGRLYVVPWDEEKTIVPEQLSFDTFLKGQTSDEEPSDLPASRRGHKPINSTLDTRPVSHPAITTFQFPIAASAHDISEGADTARSVSSPSLLHRAHVGEIGIVHALTTPIDSTSPYRQFLPDSTEALLPAQTYARVQWLRSRDADNKERAVYARQIPYFRPHFLTTEEGELQIAYKKIAETLFRRVMRNVTAVRGHVQLAGFPSYRPDQHVTEIVYDYYHRRGYAEFYFDRPDFLARWSEENYIEQEEPRHLTVWGKIHSDTVAPNALGEFLYGAMRVSDDRSTVEFSTDYEQAEVLDAENRVVSRGFFFNTGSGELTKDAVIPLRFDHVIGAWVPDGGPGGAGSPLKRGMAYDNLDGYDIDDSLNWTVNTVRVLPIVFRDGSYTIDLKAEPILCEPGLGPQVRLEDEGCCGTPGLAQRLRISYPITEDNVVTDAESTSLVITGRGVTTTSTLSISFLGGTPSAVDAAINPDGTWTTEPVDISARSRGPVTIIATETTIDDDVLPVARRTFTFSKGRNGTDLSAAPPTPTFSPDLVAADDTGDPADNRTSKKRPAFSLRYNGPSDPTGPYPRLYANGVALATGPFDAFDGQSVYDLAPTSDLDDGTYDITYTLVTYDPGTTEATQYESGHSPALRIVVAPASTVASGGVTAVAEITSKVWPRLPDPATPTSVPQPTTAQSGSNNSTINLTYDIEEGTWSIGTGGRITATAKADGDYTTDTDPIPIKDVEIENETPTNPIPIGSVEITNNTDPPVTTPSAPSSVQQPPYPIEANAGDPIHLLYNLEAGTWSVKKPDRYAREVYYTSVGGKQTITSVSPCRRQITPAEKIALDGDLAE